MSFGSRKLDFTTISLCSEKDHTQSLKVSLLNRNNTVISHFRSVVNTKYFMKSREKYSIFTLSVTLFFNYNHLYIKIMHVSLAKRINTCLRGL